MANAGFLSICAQISVRMWYNLMNPSIDIGSLGGSGWVKSICIRWEIVLEMQQKSTDTLPLMLFEVFQGVFGGSFVGGALGMKMGFCVVWCASGINCFSLYSHTDTRIFTQNTFTNFFYVSFAQFNFTNTEDWLAFSHECYWWEHVVWKIRIISQCLPSTRLGKIVCDSEILIYSKFTIFTKC